MNAQFSHGMLNRRPLIRKVHAVFLLALTLSLAVATVFVAPAAQAADSLLSQGKPTTVRVPKMPSALVGAGVPVDLPGCPRRGAAGR
jgi:hypothetical protein